MEEMVRKEGLEPPRPFGHKILSLARLPVPPLPHPLYCSGLGEWGSIWILKIVGLEHPC